MTSFRDQTVNGQPQDGWVFKIDLYGLQPVRKVRIGLDSRAIAISDDGNYLIEVRDREDRLVGRRTYEATQSQSLTLDF